MQSLTTAISVQVDKHDKEIATGILNNLGLNMSTYVNMAIKQLINKDGVPFEVVNPKPSKELVEAINEGEAILDGKLEAKSYTNMYEMLEDLKSWCFIWRIQSTRYNIQAEIKKKKILNRNNYNQNIKIIN